METVLGSGNTISSEGTPGGSGQVYNERMAADTAASEKMYGNPGGSEAEESSLLSALQGSGMEELCRGLRLDGDHEAAATLTRETNDLAKIMHEIGFSRDSALKFGELIKDYWNNPRTPEGGQEVWEKSVEEIGKEWKSETEANIKGGAEILRCLCAKLPSLKDFMEGTGMATDARLVRMLGNLSQHHKTTGRKLSTSSASGIPRRMSPGSLME